MHVLKIRWHTAWCILWDAWHEEHASRVSALVLRYMRQHGGLRRVVVECEGRESRQVSAIKKELENTFENLVEVEMVGGRVDGGLWGTGVQWGFGRSGG